MMKDIILVIVVRVIEIPAIIVDDVVGSCSYLTLSLLTGIALEGLKPNWRSKSNCSEWRTCHQHRCPKPKRDKQELLGQGTVPSDNKNPSLQQVPRWLQLFQTPLIMIWSPTYQRSRNSSNLTLLGRDHRKSWSRPCTQQDWWKWERQTRRLQIGTLRTLVRHLWKINW